MNVLHLAPHENTGSGIAHYGRAFRSVMRDAGVHIDQLADGPGPLNGFNDVWRYTSSALDQARQYDIVHAEIGGGALRQLYAALAVEHRRRTPVFLTVHDPPQLAWIPFHFDPIRRRPKISAVVRLGGARPARVLEQQLVNRAAGLFVLTESGVHAMRDIVRPSDRDNVRLLRYPTVDSESADHAVVRGDDDLVVGFVGFWYQGKGLEDLVSAIGALRDEGIRVRAHLWGDVSPTAGKRYGELYRAFIRDRVRALDLRSQVSLDGFVPVEDLGRAIGSCDVIVLPYSTSLQPTVELASTSAAMHDALAAGVPVVASDTRAMHEVITPEVNGLLFRASDPADLARQLRRLARDDALLARLHAGARSTADELGARRVVDPVIDAYRSALG